MEVKHRIALALAIAASVAQAAWWAFLVPIYQSPDEWAHLDYALAIRDHRGLLVARYTDFRSLPSDAHPYTAYLKARTDMNGITCNWSAKMPPDYGTAEFFAALDRDAPPRASIRIERPCQLASLYPFGYYALLAAWLEVVAQFDAGITAAFFAGRLFSVVLLGVSLIFVFLTTRLLRFGPWFCILTTACVGLFPLTSFVASYVQPDNLSFLLTTLAFYLSLRARNDGSRNGALAMLGLALGGLLVTKIHFFLCVAPATLGAVFTARSEVRRRWPLALAVAFAPSAILGSIWLATVWGSENYFAPPDASIDRFVNVVRLTRQAIDDFFRGTTHLSFWGVYGWLDAPIRLRNSRATEAYWFVVQMISWIFLGLTLVRLERVASRLFVVARTGRRALALRIAFSNPAINAYFLFVAFMVGLHVWTANRFGAQGRNWFPMMLPIVLVALDYAPKALTLPTSRRVLAGLAAIGLLFCGTVVNHYARETIRDRYYYRRGDRPTVVALDPTKPSEVNDITWRGSGGSANGNDSSVIYALDRPRFVYAVRIRCAVQCPTGRPIAFQAFWKNADQAFLEGERTARREFPPGDEIDVTLWIHGEISHVRLDPSARPCTFEIRELTLIRESDAAAESRGGKGKSATNSASAAE